MSSFGFGENGIEILLAFKAKKTMFTWKVPHALIYKDGVMVKNYISAQVSIGSGTVF